VKRRLVDWADGNPFFLEESVHSLEETGVLEGPRGAFRAARSTLPAEVPATVEDILATRINRLPADDRALVQSAAVIGAEVPMSVLSAVVDLSEGALESGMRRLQSAELLYESGAAAGSAFAFKHALTREVAYRTLPRPARRDLHRRIAAALESGAGDGGPQHIDRLARHAFEGELWTKAVLYLKQAGAGAMEAFAVREGAEYFAQAIDALQHLPETRQVMEDVVDLRLRVRDALWPQLRFASILDHLQKADAIAEGLGDRRRRGWIACYLSHYFWSIGELVQAGEAGERAFAIASDIDSPALLAETNFYRGLVRIGLGDLGAGVDALSAAMRGLDEVVGQAETGFPSPRFAQLGPVLVRGYLSLVLSQIGEFSRAETMGEEAIRLADASRNPFALAVAAGCLGNVYAQRTLPAKAIQFLEPGLRVCRTYEINQWITTIGVPLGAMYVQIGRVEEGLALAEECLAFSDRHGLGAWGTRLVLWLAVAYLSADRLPDAAAAAGRALAICRQRMEGGFEPAALFLLAEVAARGDPAGYHEAQSQYEEAIAIGSKSGMRPIVARCQLGLARLHARMGNQSEAAARFGTAAEALRALGLPCPAE